MILWSESDQEGGACLFNNGTTFFGWPATSPAGYDPKVMLCYDGSTCDRSVSGTTCCQTHLGRASCWGAMCGNPACVTGGVDYCCGDAGVRNPNNGLYYPPYTVESTFTDCDTVRSCRKSRIPPLSLRSSPLLLLLLLLLLLSLHYRLTTYCRDESLVWISYLNFI